MDGKGLFGVKKYKGWSCFAFLPVCIGSFPCPALDKTASGLAGSSIGKVKTNQPNCYRKINQFF